MCIRDRLEGAKFEIYAVEERGDSPSGESCATLVTGADGTALSVPLEDVYKRQIIGNGMAQVKVAANTAATELKVQNTPKKMCIRDSIWRA